MAINGIKQPETIEVDEKIRLRKFYASFDFALPWYTNVNTVYMVDGVKKEYDMKHLAHMYRYLDKSGELYFIEYKFNDNFRPIGDVTLSEKDLPIVIGDISCRGKGIGKKVLSVLIERGRYLGFEKMYVNEIYDFNIKSQKCFESVGFKPYEKTDKGSRYVLELK